MTLPSNSRVSAKYTANGTNKDFAYNFRVFYSSDTGTYGIEVRKVVDGGYEIVSPALYEVIPDDSTLIGGKIRYFTAPDSGTELYVAGKTPKVQQLNLANYGRFSAESIEANFDFMMAIIQEWLSSLDEERAQRIANDLLVNENTAAMYAEWQVWAETNVPNFAAIYLASELTEFKQEWTDALNQITIDSIPALAVPTSSGQNQQQINDFIGAKWYAKTDGYSVGDRVTLTNGDIVRSTAPNNTNDPNSNMIGWINLNLASLIKFSDGSTVQQFYDASKLKDYAFVTPEMFGCIANVWEFDNTPGLNAAFATGKDVYSTPDKVYTCNGNLRTTGQRCVGGWKIRTAKDVVGTVGWINTANTYQESCDFTYLQGVYVAYAYDLAELFAIRDLGYNTLLHYGGMHINGYDDDGTVTNLLDNAKTAGLQVLLGTQNSLNGMTLTDFVNAHKNHSAVLGFLIADEPTHNGITVAQQKTKIDTMKALTNKPLACSDFTFDAFTEVLADGYDYVFGDIYNDLGATQQQTLYKMRAWMGLTTKRHPESKVLPAVMGFKYGTGAPISDIIETSKIFARSCGGNFACFVWDGLGEPSISNSIRETASLQGLSKDICSYKTGIYSVPECYAWGTLSNSTQEGYGLQDLFEHHVRVDPNYATGYEGVNCYPAQMNGGAVESERVTPYLATGVGLAGIWFKGTFGAYISDIHIKRYNHLTSITDMLSKGAASVEVGVRGSTLGGYGVGAVLANLTVNGSAETKTFELISDTDMFCIKYDCSVNPLFYRTYIRGVYVTSDW